MGRVNLGSERTSLLWDEVSLLSDQNYVLAPSSLFIQNQQSSESPVSFHLPHPPCRPRRARQTFAAFLKAALWVLSCSHTPCCSLGLE